jgi:peptide/nickel transport system permease protein
VGWLPLLSATNSGSQLTTDNSQPKTMFRYILGRFLLFGPTLAVVSVIIFFLNHYQPGDPVSTYCALEGLEDCDEKNSERIRKRLNLDQPLFYFGMSTQAYPDTFYKVPTKTDQQIRARMLYQYGNWSAIQQYFHSVNAFYKKTNQTPNDSLRQVMTGQLRTKFLPILTESDDDEILNLFAINQALFQNDTVNHLLYDDFKNIKNQYAYLKAHPTTYKNYGPAFRWYGFRNQYHRWIGGYLRLDFGNSYQTGKPIIEELAPKMEKTVIMSGIAIFLAYLISVFLGVFSAVKKGTRLDSFVSTFLFILYSLPSFWIGMLLIFFFANPDYWSFFPPGGWDDYFIKQNGTDWEILKDKAHHLVLPIICLMYPALAFLSRQMRGGMLTALQQDYIRTARAKGLSEGKVIWKHAFRNALIPIITLLGNLLPSLIVGSIVLEVIFGIHGMGNLLFESINNQNFPVVFAIVMILAFMTILGYLISDILYAIIDPRVKF